jgi:hypothetical protein
MCITGCISSTLRCTVVASRSTLVGDIAEVKAIKKVFTDTSNIKMNATKSMIGHCLGAAAGIEAVAVVKAITSGWVHPTLNQYNLVEEVAGIDTVPGEKKQHAVRGVCGVLWCSGTTVVPDTVCACHASCRLVLHWQLLVRCQYTQQKQVHAMCTMTVLGACT